VILLLCDLLIIAGGVMTFIGAYASYSGRGMGTGLLSVLVGLAICAVLVSGLLGGGDTPWLRAFLKDPLGAEEVE
jgi:hypothetical protein